MDTSEDQGHSGPSGLSRGARGDVDHDQNDVHFWWELRRDQGWRPIGPPRFLRDAGRLACVAQVPQSGVSHLWSSCLQLHHEVWPHPWRLPIQNRQNPQLFQLHTALESGNEKVARHAGREANRHRVRHGAHDANGLQALRDWWGHPLARLDLEPPDDQRLWYEIRRILLHQPCLRQPQESLSRGPETGEGRVWPQWHPPQPHGHADGECSAEFRGHQRAHRVWQAAPLFQTWRHPGGEKHRHPGGWAGIRFSAGARLHHCKDGRHDEHWCMWISASWTERTRWWKLESRPGPSCIWVAIQGHLLQPDPRLPSGALRPPDMRIPRHLKCPRCFRQMEPVTDANIATEVARREAMAHTRGVPFSMDKVIFNHPRRGRVARQPEKGSSSSSTAVRTRSTYGNLRDMARNYVRSFKKRGFKRPCWQTRPRPILSVQCGESKLGTGGIALHRASGWLCESDHWAHQGSGSWRKAWDGHQVDFRAIVGAGARPTLGSSHRGVCVASGRLSRHWPVRSLCGKVHQAEAKTPTHCLWLGQPWLRARCGWCQRDCKRIGGVQQAAMVELCLPTDAQGVWYHRRRPGGQSTSCKWAH